MSNLAGNLVLTMVVKRYFGTSSINLNISLKMGDECLQLVRFVDLPYYAKGDPMLVCSSLQPGFDTDSSPWYTAYWRGQQSDAT